LGQVFDGLDEGHARVLHQEANRVAVFAATKAMEELLGRADRKGGGFFAVEGAQTHEVGAALFELHIATHHLDHVNASEEFLDEVLWDGHMYKREQV
jgi:hypothetical protein